MGNNKYPLKELRLLLEKPRTLRSLQTDLLEYVSQKGLGESSLKYLRNKISESQVLNKFELKSKSEAPSRFVYSSNREVDFYDLIAAVWPRAYLSNLSSLFFHKLFGRIPEIHCFALEVTRVKDKRASPSLSDQQIFDSFLKPARENKNLYKFKKQKFLITERPDRGEIGVEERSTSIPFRVTSLERALIDAIINPQYNGEIESVVESYKKAAKKIDLDKIVRIYSSLNFIYPYWQSVGFLLDKVSGFTNCEKNFHKFKVKNKFYLDRHYDESWQFDEKWQLYYPEDLL